MTTELDVGVGLVIAKQDVVARLVGLDQIVFEQQGLGFAARDGGLDPGYLGHHQPNAGAGMRFLKIARDPLFKVAGLADIDHMVEPVAHHIHAGFVRHVAEDFLEIRTGLG